MTVITIPFILILAASATTSFILGTISWKKTAIVGAKIFTLICFTMTAWTLFYIGELISPTIATKIVWYNFKFIAFSFLPLWVLIFTLQYSGLYPHLTPKQFALLSAMPAAASVLIWPPSTYHLLQVNLHIEQVGGLNLLVFNFGPLFWINLIYTMMLAGVSTFILLHQAQRARGIYRWQYILLLLSMIPPLSATAYIFYRNISVERFDPVPFTFVFTNLLLWWAHGRFHFLDLMPLIYEAVIEQLHDGVILVDLSQRVVSANPAAQTQLQLSDDQFGKPITAVLPECAALIENISHFTITSEISFHRQGTTRYFEVTVIPQKDRLNTIYGRILIFHDITRRRQAEKALQQSEAYYKTLFENAVTATVIFDENKILNLVNHQFEKLAGYTKEELENKVLWTEFIHPEDLPRLRTYHAQRSKNNGSTPPSAYEFRLIDRKKQIHDIFIRITMLPDGKHRIASLQDITTQKQATNTLKQYTAELEALLQISTAVRSHDTLDAILNTAMTEILKVIDAVAVLIYLYDEKSRTLTTFGGIPHSILPTGVVYSIDQGITGFVARTGEVYVTEDISTDPLAHFALEEQPLKEIFKGHVSVPLKAGEHLIGVLHLGAAEKRLFSPQEIRLIQAIADVVANAAHRVQIIASLEDEVAVRTTEIRSEQAISEVILSNTADGIALLDNELHIRYANKALCLLTGVDVDDLLQKSFGDLLPFELPDNLVTAVQSGQLWHGELKLVCVPDAVIDTAVTLAPIQALGQEQIGYVATITDVSQQKALEEARRTFMTNISHELRTPITNIKLHTDLLRAGPPEKKSAYLDTIQLQTDRLWHIVEDILTITALESQSANRFREEINLHHLLQTAVTRFEGQFQAQTITFQTNIATSPETVVRGHPKYLMQALTELLQNALQFTPENGKVRLETETAVYETIPGIAIHITNNGITIPEEELDKLFENFYRGTLGATGHIPGSGLGLSITQRICTLHNGKLSVENISNQGVRFTIWLPLPKSSQSMTTSRETQNASN
ncbi:MAG: hypothetical protein Kow0080_29260 [Candidatus Promineifilaceae bacterium]